MIPPPVPAPAVLTAAQERDLGRLIRAGRRARLLAQRHLAGCLRRDLPPPVNARAAAAALAALLTRLPLAPAVLPAIVGPLLPRALAADARGRVLADLAAWPLDQDALRAGDAARAAFVAANGRLGVARARAFLTRTQEIEAAGGLMLPDGSRRRTPGGVFFHLVRADDTLSREDRVSIFPPQFGRNGRKKGPGAALTQTTPAPVTVPAPAAAPSPAWADDDYRRVMAALQQETGRATTVKITVIGRPGAAVEQGQAVALALVNEKVPDLPKGLPEPPAGTRYTVFVARKQWGKIAEALAADAEDAAIIEGYAALDPRVEGIAVYATSATTKRLQAAKRATTVAETP